MKTINKICEMFHTNKGEEGMSMAVRIAIGAAIVLALFVGWFVIFHSDGWTSLMSMFT